MKTLCASCAGSIQDICHPVRILYRVCLTSSSVDPIRGAYSKSFRLINSCCGLLANKVKIIDVVGGTMVTLFPCVIFMLHM